MIRTNYPNPSRSVSPHRLDRSISPVRPVQITPSTLPVRPVPLTGQTGPNRAMS